MKTIQGPAIFLAQYMGDTAPFDDIVAAAEWSAGLGFEAIQVPTWETRGFDLAQAAESQSYCDDFRARLAAVGSAPCELSTHLQGQLVAVHPAYDQMFDGFAPEAVRGNPKARQEWATEQVIQSIRASAKLGLSATVTFPGALAWPYFYPWPQRPAGLVEEAFAELARRWKPILDVAADEGIDVCYEVHPGEDLHDGASFERFQDEVDHHERSCILFDPSHFVLQGMDEVAFLHTYHERIKMFHVKDAELRADGRTGVYGGYLPWAERAGRFRTPGHGDVDWGEIFTALARYDFPGWAVLEWEDPYQDNCQGAEQGAEFIREQILKVSEQSFDDFAASGADREANRRILGIED